MPFGPRNASTFYTTMMGVFQDKWNALYCHHYPLPVVHFGSHGIIDNILLWSLPYPPSSIRCVCTIFHKYRVMFQLKKCAFLTNRFEYSGHNITPDGNCPAESKFNLINDWPLPGSGQSLISFISLLVRNVGTRATGMTSSWIPPLVRHAANKVRHLPTALFGPRAL
jgi:hypothetical protein